jgi:broad specificity phosphatase PhoE
MKRLFVVRHGDNSHNRLTQSGIQQMYLLGECIREIMGSWNSAIICSPALWTVESSLVLAKSLHLSLPIIETNNYLTRGSEIGEECLNIIEDFEKNHKENGLIIVTHGELADEIPKYMAKREAISYNPDLGIERGKATYTDLEKKIIRVIP